MQHGTLTWLRSLRPGLALLLALALVWVPDATAAGAASPASPAGVAKMVDAGQFTRAEAAIRSATADDDLDTLTRQAYQWQQERMRRIRMDFSLDRDQAMDRVRQQISDIGEKDFAGWIESGDLEFMVIDGEQRFFKRGTSNLFLLNDAARARRERPVSFPGSPLEVPNPHHRAVLDAAAKSGKSQVLPQRIRITQHLTVDADAVPDGETLRVWVPYPQELPGQQESIRFLSSQPEGHRVAPASTAQRSVYLEQPARKGVATRFSVSYELTILAQHMAVDPARVEPVQITPELAPFVAERPPHIVFTRSLRVFSEQVVGDETDPWQIAHKLFAAVDRIPWAGAREYSTITNLSDYALHAGHADCGQQTLLLMTLLRLNGIPARWQSGAMFSPGDYWNIHDWGWLYIAPYGWLPMDVTFGRLASADPEIAGFYLGSFDGYRIAFNSDYGQSLTPEKRFFRSDNVDSQRGEVEWSGGNLYFDKWNYDFEWQVLPGAGAPEQDTTQTNLH